MMTPIQFLLVIALENILLLRKEKASHESTSILERAAPPCVANFKQNFGRSFIASKNPKKPHPKKKPFKHF